MKDRAYMIKTFDGPLKEVNLANRVVKGLISMNEPNRRGNVSKDKTFIKALLIATCTLQTIRDLDENQLPPKDILSFIRGNR